MTHPREGPTFQLYLLFEAVAGIDRPNFAEELQRFFREWRPPAGYTWTAKDEERRQKFAAMDADEFLTTWRRLRTRVKKELYE